MVVKKEMIIDLLITSIQAGKYPAQIAREHNLSRQKINYYIRKLKDEGIIKNIGYGVWETCKNSKLVAKEVRGHGFMWKVRIPKQINWKKILDNKKTKYKILENKTIRIIINERKIWLGKSNVIIYEPESFFGRSSIESKKYAVNRLLKIVYKIENTFKVNLKGNEGYLFKVARQHYSLIKNALAIQCNENNESIQVYNSKGLWFLIDDSYNLDEAETVHPDSAMVDNLGIQKYFNSHKETGFKVTPEFILSNLNALIQDRRYWAENQRTHVKAIQILSSTVKELKEEVRKLRK